MLLAGRPDHGETTATTAVVESALKQPAATILAMEALVERDEVC